MKPSVKEVIVVEGRYDKNALLQVVDATVVTTEGFGVFNDREKLALLRRLGEKQGLILLTDPDGAGFVIRNFLKGALPPRQLKHAYVPDVMGKEKRKKTGGREGKLGVEGMTPDVLLSALRRGGATFLGEAEPRQQTEITRGDLLDKGLMGPGSTEKRAQVLRRLGLPERMTTGAMLQAMQLLLTREEFEAL